MSIPDHARANFQTLLRAEQDNNLALMEDGHRLRTRPDTSFYAIGQRLRRLICKASETRHLDAMTVPEFETLSWSSGCNLHRAFRQAIDMT